MSNYIVELSNSLATVVSTSNPSIVRVDGRQRQSASGIVWSEEGVVVTADHVVTRDDAIRVRLFDGTEIPATLIGRDRTTDIALLKLEGDGLVPLPEVDKSSLAVGQMVLALGRPRHNLQATLGILSAVGEGWRTRVGGQINRYIQTDVVMYPGFSGGPLLNVEGNLVGMNTSALHPGVSLVIPVPTLARVARSLMEHGHVKRGYLGISSQRVRLPAAVREELGQKLGLLIIAVEPDSPAEEAGLTMGDTIVGLAGTAVNHHKDLLSLLTSDQIGTTVPLRIVRGGQLKTFDVSIGERP